MRLQRLTKSKYICNISNSVIIHTYKNGNKYVTIIITPIDTKIMTYKTEKEQYLDTFNRIYIMTLKGDKEYWINEKDLWKYYKYYTEE